ncbi:MAG: hypothetical protein V1897_19115 [Pseudomonadota bacterium]
MFKKCPKPNFLISAKSHNKISQNCARLHELDSQIMELRHARRNDAPLDTDKLDRRLVSCFASH